VGGAAWTTSSTRRRSYQVDANSPRRRNVNYGYPGRNNLQESYGYTLPQRTNYGYSGSGPGRYSTAHLAMAAAGGAALGVGGYYLYYQMAHNNWGSGVTYTDRSWCRVPSGQYEGNMIRCSDCAQYFGALQCRTNNDCYGAGGCQYQLPQNTRRDDIMSTGFIPAQFTPPLRLTITGISGTDYSASTCPADQPANITDSQWLGRSSFEVKMYVTLTEMEEFPSAGTPGANAARGAASPSWLLLLVLSAAFMRSALRARMSRRDA